MADATADGGAGGSADDGPNHDTGAGMPRWVKVSAIIAGILLLFVVVIKFTGVGGEHGPGRHSGASVPQVHGTGLDNWRPLR